MHSCHEVRQDKLGYKIAYLFNTLEWLGFTCNARCKYSSACTNEHEPTQPYCHGQILIYSIINNMPCHNLQSGSSTVMIDYSRYPHHRGLPINPLAGPIGVVVGEFDSYL